MDGDGTTVFGWGREGWVGAEVGHELITTEPVVAAGLRGDLDIRVLGPIEIVSPSGAHLALGTRKQRAILAILALGRGQVVSADRLVDELWGDEPPSRALSSLYPYMSNIRRLLEPGRAAHEPPSVLVSVAPGYALRLAASSFDVTRFEDGAAHAAALLAERQFDAAGTAAQQALDEWRGPALGEFASEPFAIAAAGQLEELRLTTTEDLFDARAGQGDTSVAADIERFVAAQPLRERAWAILMRSLYAAGRQSDALRAFQRARKVLADELGLQPGAELRALEESILRQDASLDVAPPRRADVITDIITDIPPSPADVPSGRPTGADAGLRDGTALDDGDASVLMAGRHAAAEAASRALDDVIAGRTRAVLVSGEAGIGKSHLVQQLTDAASAHGMRVAIGGCDDDGTPPFGPWNQILAALGCDGIGLSDTGLDPSDVEAGVRRLVETLASQLRATLRHGPLMVVLEDLHWADRSSLKCFEHITRHFRSDRLLLVGTARDGSVPELLYVLGGLARAAGFVRIELEGIARADMALLAATHAGRALREDELDVIAQRTAGNPFFVIELARWLGREGSARGGVPIGVVDVVRRQVTRLPAGVVDVLVTAAVAGQSFDVELAARAAGLPADEVFDLLDVAVVNRLVEQQRDRAFEYRFVHSLVRDAILLDLAPLRRARVHHRIAEAIAERAPGSPELAVHRWEARSVAPEAARSACRRAALAAELAYAVVDATRWWERALELERGTDSERAQVLLALGRSLARLERLDERPSNVPTDGHLTTGDLSFESVRAQAWARLLESIDVALAVGDVATAAAAAIEVGSGWNAWHWCGFRTTPDRANSRLEAVLEVIGDDRAAERAAILANLAIGTYNDEPTATSDSLSAEAVTVARTTGDEALIAHALLSRSLAIERPGRDAERRECVDEVLRLQGASVEQRASALLVRAGISLRAADRLAAESDVAAVRRLARRHRLLREDIQTQIFEVTLAVVDGDPSRAEAIAVDAIERGVARMGPGGPPLGFLALYSMRLAQGRLPELIEDARVVAPQLEVAIADLVGPALLAADRRPEAAALARGIDATADVPPDWFWLGQHVLRATLAAAVGPEPLTRREYELLAPFAGLAAIVPGFVAVGIVDVALGRLAHALGDVDAAMRHFTAGADIARRLGAALWADDASAAAAAATAGSD
jgi:DNA-binding SARP family transcriptional activator